MTSVTASDAAFLELASSLTPVAVSQYLAVTRPWQLESRQGDVSEIWSLPGDDSDLQGRIMLPFATDYVDFPERFFDALCSIGFINDWDADQVGRRIAAARADILLIRLDQLDAMDTIPLGQADATLDAIHQMLRHAAVTAPVPRRAKRGGRPPREVSAFLDENVRLGHTKRGSFVFTVVTSLDEPSNSVLAPDDGGVADARFSRKVMITLARGLEAAYGLVQGDQPEVLEDPGRWGLSAGLVESLAVIAAPNGLRSVTMQFEWASAVPAPDAGQAPIQLEHSAVAQLARVQEILLREEEPAHRETLVGQVISLARDSDSDLAGEAGSAVLSAEVNGRKRNVHMILSGPDHSLAIRAYELQRSLVVTGDLAFERRAWRLTGDIEVDARLLDRDSR